MSKFRTQSVALALTFFALTACSVENERQHLVSVGKIEKREIIPIPEAPQQVPATVKLGARLFHDPRLSKNLTISCASCHHLSAGGDDGRRLSIGTEGKSGQLNAPSILNSRFNFRQFWDGRAEDLESQIDGPIHTDFEMGASWPLIINRLENDKQYIKEFSRLFKDGISENNIKHAIAEFERALITPNSPFDRYLSGDENALSEFQKYGYERFKSLGCVSCHQGVNVGGNMYQKIGIIHDYFDDRGDIRESDFGLYNTTLDEDDKYKFKVPSLRNVILTAPYFHDGSVDTLRLAIEKMAYYQLGEKIRDEDAVAIEAFLATLTGELDLARLSANQ